MDCNRHKDLIDLARDIPLIAKYNTVDYLYRADNAFQAWLTNRGARESDVLCDLWERVSALGAVYQIGRIQGIREERQRRKESV